MSLSVYLTEVKPAEIYWRNITHNLAKMAGEVGIYEELWRPDELGITRARELIDPLTKGLSELESRPEHYRQFNAENGWGVYENLVEFVRDYLRACIENPDADVSVSR